LRVSLENAPKIGFIPKRGSWVPHLTQCRLGRGLPPRQVASLSPTVWPQYTNVTLTDRPDRQRSDSIGRPKAAQRCIWSCLSVTLVRRFWAWHRAMPYKLYIDTVITKLNDRSTAWRTKNVNLLASQWQAQSAFHYAAHSDSAGIYHFGSHRLSIFRPVRKIHSFWGTYGHPINSFACFKDMMVTQNLKKNISHDHDHDHLWWFLIPTLILSVAYRCTRFEHFRFLYLRSKDMKEDPKI